MRVDWVPRVAPLCLRVLLGATFVYAGLQKLVSREFFDPRNPASINAQMAYAAHTSPIHALVAPLLPHASLVGHAIAFGEIAVSIAALLGLYTHLAALGGVVLSLSFWLTVNAHVHPVYFVPDYPWAALWALLWMLGPGELLALDYYLGILQLQTPPSPPWHPNQGAWGGPPAAGQLPRRQVLGYVLAVGGSIGAVVLAMRIMHMGPFAASTANIAIPTPQISPGSGGQSSASSSPSASPAQPGQPAKPAGQEIGTVAQLRVGGSLKFTHQGSPAVALRPSRNSYLGLSLVCTHAGCISNLPAGGKIVCGCHGSVFSATNGAVLQGPANTPLSRINITAVGGKLYAS